MALLISPAELSARFSTTSFGGMWNFVFLWPLGIFLEVPVFWHSEEAIFCNVFTMLVWAMGLKLQERERERKTERKWPVTSDSIKSTFIWISFIPLGTAHHSASYCSTTAGLPASTLTYLMVWMSIVERAVLEKREEEPDSPRWLSETMKTSG